MPSIQQLTEKRVAAYNAANELLKKPELSGEDRAKFDTFMTEVNSLAQDIDRVRKAEETEKELRTVNFKPESQTGNNGKETNQRSAKEQDELELRAFHKFCTKGRSALTAEENSVIKTETRAEGTSAGTGGDLIPPAFQRQLEVAMKYYAPFTEYADVFDTADGAPMIWPVSSSVTRECQLVAEGSAVTDHDIGTDKVTFGAFKFGDLVKVGLEISQDAFTSVDGIVVDVFAQSFGRGLTKKFTKGAGTTEPTGIVTAATQGPLVTGDDNQDSPDPLTEVGYFDMLALLHSVDLAYRNQPGAAWMLNDNTLLAIQKLKDKFGHPLWQPSFASDQGDRILGKPYIINQQIDDIGASKKPVLFGDLSRYKVRRVKNMTIQRLVERYAEFGQVGLIAWARYDGNLLDAGQHPVKYLVCPAS